jgi:cell wall assembly regulator SMI1
MTPERWTRFRRRLEISRAVAEEVLVTRLTAALEGLERAWLRNGMPHTHWLMPGLEASDVQAALAAVDLAPPADVIEWFGWHNGTVWSLVTEGDVYPALGLGSFVPLSLAEALDERSRMAELAASLAEDPMAIPEDLPLWEPSWLPIGRSSGGALLTPELGTEKTVRVRVVDYWDQEFKKVRAESLAEVVEHWVEWLDGFCEWDPAVRTWSYDFAALPVELRLSVGYLG